MEFDLNPIEQMCIDMYRTYTNDRSDPMSGVFLLQSMARIDRSSKLSAMMYQFYDGSGI
jgi:hypothetical protein